MTLFRSLLLTGLAVAVLAAPVSAQTVRRLDAQHVSVRAEGVPLSQLLDDLKEFADFEVVLLDPKVEKAPVTAVIERAPIATVVTDVLKQAGVSFAVGGLEGQAMRVVIRDVGVPTPQTAADAAPPAPAEPEPLAAPVVAENAMPADVTPAEPTADAPAAADPAAPAMVTSAMGMAPPTAEPMQIYSNGPSDTIVTSEFTMVGETVTYHDPTFVPLKLRPEFVARRKSMDISTIP